MSAGAMTARGPFKRVGRRYGIKPTKNPVTVTQSSACRARAQGRDVAGKLMLRLVSVVA